MTKDEKSNTICNTNKEDLELRRGPWTLEEDKLLIHYIACHGEGRWNSLAKSAGLKRTGKSCRLRWLNYLKPDIKRGNLTPQEQILILELHSRWGNRWSKIAQHLPGRTDNEIKNYWRTRVQKQARQLKVDANSKTFLEAIRFFWMPRLLQKMEQKSSNSTSTSTSSSSMSNMENQDSTFSYLPPNQASLASASAKRRKLMGDNNADHKDKSNSPDFSNSCSSDSETVVMELPELEENPSSSAQTWRSHGHYNSFQDHYSAECFSLQAMSAYGESQDSFLSEYQTPELDDWFNDDVAGAFWNTDELWQFIQAEQA